MLAWVGALAAPFLFPYEGIGYAINLGVAGLVLIWMAKMLEGQEAQTALLQKLTAGGGPLPVLRARTVEFDDLETPKPEAPKTTLAEDVAEAEARLKADPKLAARMRRP